MKKNSGHKSKWELVTIPCTKDILPITRGIVPKPADYVPERICHIFGDILFIGMRNVILYTFFASYISLVNEYAGFAKFGEHSLERVS